MTRGALRSLDEVASAKAAPAAASSKRSAESTAKTAAAEAATAEAATTTAAPHVMWQAVAAGFAKDSAWVTPDWAWIVPARTRWVLRIKAIVSALPADTGKERVVKGRVHTAEAAGAAVLATPNKAPRAEACVAAGK